MSAASLGYREAALMGLNLGDSCSCDWAQL
jgi:hypothetical protein